MSTDRRTGHGRGIKKKNNKKNIFDADYYGAYTQSELIK